MSTHRQLPVRALKAASNLLALVLVSPAALTCWLEDRLLPGAEGVFWFWTHVFAVLPGIPGMYLRRAFYSQTLRSCSLNCCIDFGVLFPHRTAHVEEEVYIGAYSVVGSARLRRGCMIGTRASLLSGSAQHERRADGSWGAVDPSRFREIEIGEHAWVGEAAIVMADVGAGAQIAAGAVVSAAVPPSVVVAGNPARFIREVPQTSVPPAEPGSNNVLANDRYEGSIDWLKCLGILLIVYGHTAGWAPLAALPPIYTKQIGVALFMFVTGYSLRRDTRSRWHVVFNRLFEVYLFGVALAVIMSAVTYLTHGRVQISNYAPFLGGVNVFFNFFPANPTTWYLGTYFHVIVLWALVAHRLRVTIPMLVVSLATEIVVRAVLMETAGGFVAYMALPNWLTVFLLGAWYGQRGDEWPRRTPEHVALGAGIAVVALTIGWSFVAAELPFARTFPLMQLPTYSVAMGALLVSAMISMIYLGTTWMTALAVTNIPTPASVRFVARNTLIIFLAHMPVVHALQPALANAGVNHIMTSAILMIVSVPGLGLLSEVLHRGGRIRMWRDALYARRASARAPLEASETGN